MKFGHLFKLEMRLEWTTDTALALHAVLCIIKRLMFIRDRTFRTAVAILLRTTFPFGKPRTMLNPLQLLRCTVISYLVLLGPSIFTLLDRPIETTYSLSFIHFPSNAYIYRLHNINRIILTERNYM